ncbi:hypothetical protein Tco_0652159 [Tanacetum coccineum]|uniref:Uncharacterized protein n=1 Tax=Tanacetum coccineum TaxID=301880 RepID=A0ABQ4WX09_9ASTR
MVMFLLAALAMKIQIASMRATGVNDSSKSIPSYYPLEAIIMTSQVDDLKFFGSTFDRTGLYKHHKASVASCFLVDTGREGLHPLSGFSPHPSKVPIFDLGSTKFHHFSVLSSHLNLSAILQTHPQPPSKPPVSYL